VGLGFLIVEVSRSHSHTTSSRTPIDKSRRKDLYLPTHNTNLTQTTMTPAGFEPTIPARHRPQTHASGSTATAIGCCTEYRCNSVLKEMQRWLWTEKWEPRKSKRLCSIWNFSTAVPMKEPKEITQDLNQKRIIGYPKRDMNSGIKVRLVT